MRLFLLLVLGVLIPLWVGGCSRFTKSFRDVGFQCGWDQPVSAGVYAFKLLKPSGESLSDSERAVTSARILRDDGTTQTLALSSRGCVQVPGSDGVLQVHSLSLDLHISAKVSNLFRGGTGLQDLTLGPNSKDFRAEIICPNEGFFAADTLPFPVQLSHTGLDAFRLLLNVSSSTGSPVMTLFQKNMATPALCRRSWMSGSSMKALMRFR